MTKPRGRKSPASKPASEKKKQAPQAAKPRGKSKAAVQKPQTGQLFNDPIVAAEIVKAPYTLVYANRSIWVDILTKTRRILLRGEVINLTQAGYDKAGPILKRALVKGALGMGEVHALLKNSQGQVPGTAGFGLQPVETIDPATAMPVKDQESQATTVTLSLPNFVPMSTDDIRAWAGESRVRDWLGDLPEELTKKHEIVKAIKDRMAELEAAPNSKPGVPEVPAAPGGGFEDV